MIISQESSNFFLSDAISVKVCTRQTDFPAISLINLLLPQPGSPQIQTQSKERIVSIS